MSVRPETLDKYADQPEKPHINYPDKPQNDGPVKPAIPGRMTAAVVVLTVLFVVTFVVLVVIVALYVKETEKQYSVQDELKSCSECDKCYSCLEGETGQDVRSLCYSNQAPIATQCASQIEFLFSGSRVDRDTPCRDECPPCSKCLSRLKSIKFHQKEIGWTVYYDSWFTGSDRRGGTESATSDDDACCGTTRTETALIDPVVISGITWYPVWFYTWFAAIPYYYQYYDEVTCQLDNPQCDESIACTVHYEDQTFLMTTTPSSDSYGHSWVTVSHPSSTVQFKTISVPMYCKCVT